jgi:hypothetical protein
MAHKIIIAPTGSLLHVVIAGTGILAHQMSIVANDCSAQDVIDWASAEAKKIMLKTGKECVCQSLTVTKPA